MAKPKSVFCCQLCGFQSSKWLGKCPGCNNWNTLVEEIVEEKTPHWKIGNHKIPKPIPVTEIKGKEADRIKTGSMELDRVLGGGILPGSIILLGGDPGIGKSTILLQTLNNIASLGLNTLYISGEESEEQTKLRGDRLGILADTLFIYTETSLERIINTIKEMKPKIVVIDSIQTIFTEELTSSPGSIGQVRECSARLMLLGKRLNIPIILVGHVTKEGSIAGPRVLEHIVDTVLYFEGDGGHAYRILRTVKNRFGSTNEIGVFEMTDKGLKEVLNPSEIFLSERPTDTSGSIVVPSIEGTRPILIEVQALVSTTNLGVPRRTAIGIDSNRLALLTAVLEKKIGLRLFNQDIFLNIAGGVKINEPAVDLGIAIAIISSALDYPVDPKIVSFGEIGLTGEIRGIGQAELRISEAKKLGFNRCIMPESNIKRASYIKEIEIIGVKHLKEVFYILFSKRK